MWRRKILNKPKEEKKEKSFSFRNEIIQLAKHYKHNDEELSEEIKSFCEDFIMSQILKRKGNKKG